MPNPAIPNLVPPAHELGVADNVISPIEVLRVQAEHWTDQTGGEIVGEVERTETTPDKLAFWFGFSVPMLGYRYRLFLVEHGLEFYPLEISSKRGEPSPVQVRDEAHYYDELRKRFSSKATLDIVRQLRALTAEAQAATPRHNG